MLITVSLFKDGCALGPQGNLANTAQTGPQRPGCALTVTASMSKDDGHNGNGVGGGGGGNDAEGDSYLESSVTGWLLLRMM